VDAVKQATQRPVGQRLVELIPMADDSSRTVLDD